MFVVFIRTFTHWNFIVVLISSWCCYCCTFLLVCRLCVLFFLLFASALASHKIIHSFFFFDKNIETNKIIEHTELNIWTFLFWDTNNVNEQINLMDFYCWRRWFIHRAWMIVLDEPRKQKSYVIDIFFCFWICQ